MSILATVCTLAIAFPGGVVHREDRARPGEVGAVRPVPDPVLGERDRAHAGLDDPAARIGRAAAAARRPRHHRGAGRDALPRRDDPRRPRLHVDAVHGRAARERAREPRRFADRGRVRPGRQRLVDPAADRRPARGAGHRRGLDRRVHADARQLPDADAARRQELAVVHRADLHAVHHALQLGAGRGVRLPAADPVHRDRLARA